MNKKEYFKFRILNNRGAFTLLETIITLFIITFMLALFLTNYREGSRNTELTFAVQKLVSDLRTAQNNSLGSVYYGGAVPAGGWGIRFVAGSNNYTFFADSGPVNRAYDAGEALPASGGRIIDLPANIVIDSIVDAGSTARTPVDITFLPPDPVTRIYWNSGFSSSTSATITLRETTKGRTKILKVNILGLIEAP